MLPQRLFVLLALLSFAAHAQWLSYPDSRTPRTKDGKPNLTAPLPRTNRNPDLSGVWELDPTPLSELIPIFSIYKLMSHAPRST
jgi:hypothetical protein